LPAIDTPPWRDRLCAMYRPSRRQIRTTSHRVPPPPSSRTLQLGVNPMVADSPIGWVCGPPGSSSSTYAPAGVAGTATLTAWYTGA
jgi:hypothetical protein